MAHKSERQFKMGARRIGASLKGDLALDRETADWIESASTITDKGDIDEYAHLMWSRCLGLAWRGL